MIQIIIFQIFTGKTRLIHLLDVRHRCCANWPVPAHYARFHLCRWIVCWTRPRTWRRPNNRPTESRHAFRPDEPHSHSRPTLRSNTLWWLRTWCRPSWLRARKRVPAILLRMAGKTKRLSRLICDSRLIEGCGSIEKQSAQCTVHSVHCVDQFDSNHLLPRPLSKHTSLHDFAVQQLSVGVRRTVPVTHAKLWFTFVQAQFDAAWNGRQKLFIAGAQKSLFVAQKLNFVAKLLRHFRLHCDNMLEIAL